jgi:hypothetical protein
MTTIQCPNSLDSRALLKCDIVVALVRFSPTHGRICWFRREPEHAATFRKLLQWFVSIEFQGSRIRQKSEFSVVA